MNKVRVTRDPSSRTPANHERAVTVERRFNVTGADPVTDHLDRSRQFVPVRAVGYVRVHDDSTGTGVVHCFGETGPAGLAADSLEWRFEFNDAGRVTDEGDAPDWVIRTLRHLHHEASLIWWPRTLR